MDPSPLLLLLILLLISIIPTTTSVTNFTPATNYLLSCGGSSTASAAPSDLRTFEPDSAFFPAADSQPISVSSNSSSLHSTARLFRRASSYRFSIATSSLHFLRLHFLPSAAYAPLCFSVAASSLPLLTNFTPPPQLSIKEFLINVTLPSLTLTISPLPNSLAIVNAIELFSAPPGLLAGLPYPALSTAHRLNVGGNTVTPQVDLLWRNWDVDRSTTGDKIAIYTAINYQDTGTSTRYIAPDAVYRSARVVNLNSSFSARFNLSWILPVSSGRRYLVRLHFCDIVSLAVGPEFAFNIYIDDQMKLGDYDLSVGSATPAYPYYKDFYVDAGSSAQMSIMVGPSNKSGYQTINAILNGLEVMEVISDSLVSENPLRSKTKVGLVVGCVVAAILIAVVVAAAIALGLRRKKKAKSAKPEPPPGWTHRRRMSSTGSAPLLTSTAVGSNATVDFTPRTGDSPAANLHLELKIPLVDIRSATGDFDRGRQIGSGGFGKVYEGLLPDGTRVAVKRATPGSRQGLPEFQTEILVLSKIRHRHLVSLIGYCDEQGEMILVYEFMEKGTLRDYLRVDSGDSGSDRSPTWRQRLEMCIGAARGLHYLHTGDSHPIIHRDVKSSNILLDGDLRAKVADFGLSKQGPPVNQTHVSTAVKGSFGYLDPEYYKTQQLTEKSDVYSFGVVLLEVACARPAIDQSLPYEQVNLADWGMAWLARGRLEEIMDRRIRGDASAGSLRKFAETAAKCLAPAGGDRPAMGDVLWNLEYALRLQETSVRREPHEDSVSGPSAMIPMVNIRRLPSSLVGGPSGDLDGAAADASSEWGDAQVFSHLVHGEGR